MSATDVIEDQIVEHLLPFLRRSPAPALERALLDLCERFGLTAPCYGCGVKDQWVDESGIARCDSCRDDAAHAEEERRRAAALWSMAEGI